MEPAWVAYFVGGLILLIVFLVVVFARSLRERGLGQGRAWLDYAPFFLVALAIVAVLVGFLVTVLFFVRPGQADLTDVLALLAALFGIIGTLVGTFFGIRASLDVNEGAVKLALSGSGTTPLVVTAVTPKPEEEVAIQRPSVTATFSKAIDPATITRDTFWVGTVPEGGGAPSRVPGGVTYDAPSITATFTPSEDLPAGTSYQEATITTGVRDIGGIALALAYTWRFKVTRPTTTTTTTPPPTTTPSEAQSGEQSADPHKDEQTLRNTERR